MYCLFCEYRQFFAALGENKDTALCPDDDGQALSIARIDKGFVSCTDPIWVVPRRSELFPQDLVLLRQLLGKLVSLREDCMMMKTTERAAWPMWFLFFDEFPMNSVVCVVLFSLIALLEDHPRPADKDIKANSIQQKMMVWMQSRQKTPPLIIGEHRSPAAC